MADDVTDNSPTTVDLNDLNDPRNPNSPLNPNNPNYVANGTPQVVQGQPTQPLVDTGTDTNIALGTPTSVLPVQQTTQADVQLKEQQDELFAAVARGDRVRVEELIDRGADVNKPDNTGTTAIMDAVENNDMNVSRDFLQQRANGNIAYDPNADQNLTGGLSADNPLNPLAALGLVGGQPSAIEAEAVGLTAAEAMARGDYALAAQLEADENYAQEAREENEGEGADADWDGDMSYEASVSDEDENDGNEYNPYDDPWGDDDMYADNEYDPYDDYDDPYGEDDDPSGGLYDDPNAPIVTADGTTPDPSTTADPSTTTTDPSTTATTTNPDGTTTSSPGIVSTFLGAVADVGTFVAADMALSNPSLMTNGYTGSSLLNMMSMASSDPSTFGTSPTNTSTSPSGSSMFFNFASPTTGGNSVWNTQFFDPQNVISSLAASTPQVTAPSIAPTNPYYKPSSTSSMSMGA